MKEQLEIEFKNLLTLDEYNKIYNHYNLHLQKTINNSNYYYDTCDGLLKNNNAALRIRHTNTNKEMTLKIKGVESNIELNVPIDSPDILDILETSNIDLSIAKKLNEFGINKNLVLFQKIVTERKELELSTGLIVLDKNYYLNDIIDYELEFEVDNYEVGEKEFRKMLSDLKIENRPALPKIARAQEYINKWDIV